MRRRYRGMTDEQKEKRLETLTRIHTGQAMAIALQKRMELYAERRCSDIFFGTMGAHS